MNGTICGKQLMKDVLVRTGGAHPRLMLTTEDFIRLRDGEDMIYKTERENILRRADELAAKKEDGQYDTPLCTYRIPDGIRLLSTSRQVLDRVMVLSFAWKFTEKEEYLERAVAEMESAARFPDWNPYHFLDVGEMCTAFAIGYDWLYHGLSADRRRRLRVAMIEKGLRQAQADYRDYFRRRSYRWYQDKPGDNWKFICNGGVTMATLAIFDEEPEEQPLFCEVLECAFADSYIAVRDFYMPDGSYSEGFNYWNYASTFLAYYTDSLRTAAGSDYGLTDYEPLKKSAYYVKYLCSNRFLCFNFGDASEVGMCQPVFLWFAKNFNAGDIAAIRVDYRTEHPDALTPEDLIWYDHRLYAPFSPTVLDLGEVGSDNASFRDSWDLNGLYAAIHFGNNDAYHHHLDTGTFVVDWAGKRFFCDLGADNYNVPHYRCAYRYRAEGHNTLLLHPGEERDQSPHSHCPITAYKGGTDGDSFAVCDMTDAYRGIPVRRGMKMCADRRTIVVQDEIGCAPDAEGIWAAHTKASVTLSPDGASATLTLGKACVTVRILTGQTFEIADAVLADPKMIEEGQRDNSEFRKLVIRFRGSGTIAVSISPDADRVPSVTALDDWK